MLLLLLLLGRFNGRPAYVIIESLKCVAAASQAQEEQHTLECCNPCAAQEARVTLNLMDEHIRMPQSRINPSPFPYPTPHLLGYNGKNHSRRIATTEAKLSCATNRFNLPQRGAAKQVARQHNTTKQAYFTLDLAGEGATEREMETGWGAASGSSRLISFICSFDDDDAGALKPLVWAAIKIERHHTAHPLHHKPPPAQFLNS